MIDEILQIVLGIIRVIKITERGISGKVNFAGMLFVGTAGVIEGKLFTSEGAILLLVFVLSAIISDMLNRRSNALNRILRFLERVQRESQGKGWD